MMGGGRDGCCEIPSTREHHGVLALQGKSQELANPRPETLVCSWMALSPRVSHLPFLGFRVLTLLPLWYMGLPRTEPQLSKRLFQVSSLNS